VDQLQHDRLTLTDISPDDDERDLGNREPLLEIEALDADGVYRAFYLDVDKAKWLQATGLPTWLTEHGV
jgi:hypothetical protein